MKRIVVLSLLLVGFAVGQTPTGTIKGTVQDSQGAAVPGAAISLVSSSTGLTKQATSDSSGRFEVPFLTPGAYAVSVEAKGFRVAKRENVVVEISVTVPLEFILQVGAAVETVEVNASTGGIETETSTVDTVVRGNQIDSLPLNGRNPFTLAALVPGVNTTGDDQRATTPHIGGSRNANNEMTIDGVSNILPENNVGNNWIAYQPIVDSVQEFSVQTSVLPAENGRFSGGTMSLLTRSGGSQFHGSGFLFARNAIFDAPPYSSNGVPPKVPDLYRYQEGGTLGGPIPVDRSKHSFFFVAYEDSKLSGVQTSTATVPQPVWLTGDFSALLPAVGSQVPDWTNPKNPPIPFVDCNTTPAYGCIYDPLTISGNTRQAFPGNIIPSNRINSVAVNMMKYYPSPNLGTFNPATPNLKNYSAVGASKENYYHWDTRLDHDFTSKWHSFLRLSHWHDHNNPFPDTAFNNALGSPNAASLGWGGKYYQTQWSSSFDNNITISPTLLAEFRYGLSRQAYTRVGYGSFNLSSLGFPAAYNAVASTGGLVFPAISVSDGYTGEGPYGWNAFYEKPTSHNFFGSLTKIAGAHSIKVGGEFRKIYENFAQFAQPSGAFTFNDHWTQFDTTQANVVTGNPFASMLLGLDESGYMSHDAHSTDASGYLAFFGQDDWKATRKLTLNVGLRWDMEIPRTDRFNHLSYWDPTLASPIATQVSAALPAWQAANPGLQCTACANLMGQMVFVGTSGAKFGRRQGLAQKKDFAPRVGFAYNPGKDLAIRGGYGIVYAASALQAAGTTGGPGIEGFASSTNFTTSFDQDHTISGTITNPAPTGFNLPKGVAGGAATDLGSGISDSFFASYRNPYTEQWNFNIQKGLPGHVTAEVGYLGNHGLFLIDGDPGRNYDQLPISDLALGSQLTQTVSNPFFGIITTPGSALSQSTISYNQLLRPYPQYTGVTGFRKPQGESKYNAFTAKLDTHLSHGLSLLAAFTASKTTSNSAASVTYLGPTSGTYANAYAPQNEWSVDPADISRTFVVAYTYELPLGHGKALLGNAGRLANGVLGGWQTQGIITWNSGTPLVLGAAANQTNIFTSGQRPDWNGKDAKISNPSSNKWFDYTVFSQPAIYTIGNAPRTIPDVRTPGYNNFDLSFFKNARLGSNERYNLQFRAEMFNAFNHPLFGGPDMNVGDTHKCNPTTGLQCVGFGTINGSAINSSREIQLAMKFTF